MCIPCGNIFNSTSCLVSSQHPGVDYFLLNTFMLFPYLFHLEPSPGPGLSPVRAAGDSGQHWTSGLWSSGICLPHYFSQEWSKVVTKGEDLERTAFLKTTDSSLAAFLCWHHWSNSLVPDWNVPYCSPFTQYITVDLVYMQILLEPVSFK